MFAIINNHRQFSTTNHKHESKKVRFFQGFNRFHLVSGISFSCDVVDLLTKFGSQICAESSTEPRAEAISRLQDPQKR